MLGKIQLSLVASDAFGGIVISPGRFFCCVVSTEPDPDTLLWISNLRSPFSPGSLSDASVNVLSGPSTVLLIFLHRRFVESLWLLS